mmetsp:Transcript_6432/g.20100  ORF Transcript_6432/g.20100 Transcript_6432/m.20100 type:complete len:323 (+) Transcript_6432:1328-2296(+)
MKVVVEVERDGGECSVDPHLEAELAPQCLRGFFVVVLDGSFQQRSRLGAERVDDRELLLAERDALALGDAVLPQQRAQFEVRALLAALHKENPAVVEDAQNQSAILAVVQRQQQCFAALGCFPEEQRNKALHLATAHAQQLEAVAGCFDQAAIKTLHLREQQNMLLVSVRQRIEPDDRETAVAVDPSLVGNNKAMLVSILVGQHILGALPVLWRRRPKFDVLWARERGADPKLGRRGEMLAEHGHRPFPIRVQRSVHGALNHSVRSPLHAYVDTPALPKPVRDALHGLVAALVDRAQRVQTLVFVGIPKGARRVAVLAVVVL